MITNGLVIGFYLILRRLGDKAGPVVNFDRLQPYMPCPYRLISTGPNNDNLNYQLVDERENNIDTEQYVDESILLANQLILENAEDEFEQIICILP